MEKTTKEIESSCGKLTQKTALKHVSCKEDITSRNLLAAGLPFPPQLRMQYAKVKELALEYQNGRITLDEYEVKKSKLFAQYAADIDAAEKQDAQLRHNQNMMLLSQQQARQENFYDQQMQQIRDTQAMQNNNINCSSNKIGSTVYTNCH
ncbi:MAG: hypothetical protein SFW65_08435 [Alphaproteobacteria bacterium]|nr:hypothetical protein [Alphaproteobacteria bacterium]